MINQHCFCHACTKMTVNSSFLSSSLICPWSFPLTPHTFFCPAFFPLNLLPSPPSFLLPPHCFLSPHLFPHYSLNSLSPIPFFSPISPSSRKAERRMSFLERQKDECVLEEGKTRHYLGAVISLAQHISQERDQLLYTVLLTQQNHFLFFMVRIVPLTPLALIVGCVCTHKYLLHS